MDHTSTPLVTAMIATRNRPDDLVDALASLRGQTLSAIEVIIIDDASSVDLEPLVAREWPSARFHRNGTNLGYIASRSLGMSMARGRYILSLDDDAVLTDPLDLERAVDRFEREPQIGMQTFYIHNGPNMEGVVKQQPQERYVHTFVGCGHLLRRQAYDELGGYCDAFSYYGEELEYSLRLLNAGWRILFFPSVLVHHKVSQAGRSDGKIWGHSVRNAFWTMVLHFPLDRLVVESVWKTGVHTVELARRWEFRWAAWAIISFVLGLPAIVRHRHPISRSTVRLYDALRFRAIRTDGEYDRAMPPTLPEFCMWFLHTWMDRRRAPAAWHRGRGGIGSSASASFSPALRTITTETNTRRSANPASAQQSGLPYEVTAANEPLGH